MSGASISITLSGSALRGFQQLERVMDNTTPVMADIGKGLVASTHMRFVTQTDPDGAAWRALNTDYAATKRNTRILTESGRLRDSINSRAGATEVRVGTNVPYAAIHQFGGTIKPKSASHLRFFIGDALVTVASVTLPARPFLGISSDDETMIAETIFDFLERYVPSSP
ncbi:phage virion morphogeneis protein [Shinella sp. SUS2]|uniref:phage virion morphogenesis protein n=1 Tax=unclassified Shinella TaxID=2643062 RepID=UPI00067FDC04|nr:MULTISPECIES: phage virion morphogenesis protein [unclassified Shinella]KNY13615.1 phage virion morphogeneis protein [Shinella sp. SUS2]KOC72508.1 phage morphogenesis protein [Shinella sp. GWS1]